MKINNKNDDLIANTKNLLFELYKTKIFKLIFYAFIIYVIFYNKVDIKKSNKNVSTIKNVVSNIALIKSIRTGSISEVDKKKLKMIKQIEINRKKEELMEEKQQVFEKEYTLFENKNGKEIKNNDQVTLKYVIKHNGVILSNDESIVPLFIVDSNNKEDIFSKELVGKHIGDVFELPFNKIFKNSNVRNTLSAMKNYIKDPDFNINTLSTNSVNLSYLVKILEYKQ